MVDTVAKAQVKSVDTVCCWRSCLLLSIIVLITRGFVRYNAIAAVLFVCEACHLLDLPVLPGYRRCRCYTDSLHNLVCGSILSYVHCRRRVVGKVPIPPDGTVDSSRAREGA